MFRKIQAHVGIMVDMFKKSKFFLCVAQKQNYQDGIVFTENNIVQYLAELEEFISNFITFLAQKEKNPDAPVSALSLDQMNNKEFDKGPLAVEHLPNSN